MNRRKMSRLLERGLFLVAVGLLGYWAYVQLGSQLTRQHVLHAMEKTSGQAAGTLREIVAESGFVGRIEIPRTGLDAVILAEADDRSLDLGVGHLSKTALPDEPGNFVLAGHRDSHFRPLEDIRLGDAIRVTTVLGTYDYEVEETMTVWPEQVEVIADTGEPRLTLVTCYPFRYVGSAPRRFIVRARPVPPFTKLALASPAVPGLVR